MDPTNPSPPHIDPPTQPEEILAPHPMDEPPCGLHDSGAANGAQPTLTNAAYSAAVDRGTDPQEEEAQDANNSADATDANHWQQQAVAASPFRGCVAVPRLPHGRHASRKRDGDGSTRPLKSSSPGLCSVNDRLAESNDPNLRDLADVQEQEQTDSTAHELCKFNAASTNDALFGSGECNDPAVIGGYCKVHYDSMVQEESLLLNNSANAPDASVRSGEEESGEDEKNTQGSGEDEPQSKNVVTQDTQEEDKVPTTTAKADKPPSNAADEKTKQQPGESLPPRTLYSYEPDSYVPILDIKQRRKINAECQNKTSERRKSKVIKNDESRNKSVESKSPPSSNPANENIQEESAADTASPNDAKSKGPRGRTKPPLDQEAVDYLRAWMLSRQHIENPYPSEVVLAQLGRVTGLEKPQLQNWFGNNRKRVWRPVMEELRSRNGLSENDPLPQSVLDTLEDEPSPPRRSDEFQPIPSSDALFCTDLGEDDTEAAAAMILMTGSRASSPTEGAAHWVSASVTAVPSMLTKEATEKNEEDKDRDHISPTTITQIHAVTAAPAGDASAANAAELAPDNRARSGSTGGARSPLDLLSTAASVSSDSLVSDAFVPTTCATATRSTATTLMTDNNSSMTGARKFMCNKCEACLREDCGECAACKDKIKFGGQGKVRRKCSKRLCPNMSAHNRGHNGKRPKEVPKEEAATTGVTTDDAAAKNKLAKEMNLAHMATEKRWSENLTYLRPCIESGGLINYAIIADDDIRGRVKNYVKYQRKSYQRRMAGENTSMTDERLRLLMDANFPFTHKAYPKSKEPPAKKNGPVSSLDLLCSAVSQSFEQLEQSSSSWQCDAATTEDDDHHTVDSKSSFTAPATLDSSEFQNKNPRGRPCGECEACLRDDCGTCKACLDKRKFGGPNKLRRRCFNRCCIQLEESNPCVTNAGGIKQINKGEEQMMKSELSRISAELAAKAAGRGGTRSNNGWKRGGFGLELPRFKGAEVMPLSMKTRSRTTTTLDTLLREVEEEEAEGEMSDSEDDVTESSSEDEEDDDESVMETFQLSNAVYKTAVAAAGGSVIDVPRGVTIRASGKWQVQRYYAGASRYIGLFDSREEAATAYEVARECCESFALRHQNPSLDQVKRNLESIRKAAFASVANIKGESGTASGMKRKERSDADEEGNKPVEKRGRGRPKKKRKPESSALVKKTPAVVKKTPAVVKKDTTAAATTKVKKVAMGKTRGQTNATRPPSGKISQGDVEVESLKRKFSPEVYERAKALAGKLPRGVTVRPSGKWQVQIYYAGKSRYIGVFDSRLDAAVAYELVRECCLSFKDTSTPDEVNRHVQLMRKAASLGKGYQKTTDVAKKNPEPPTKKHKPNRTIGAAEKMVRNSNETLDRTKEAPPMLPPTKKPRVVGPDVNVPRGIEVGPPKVAENEKKAKQVVVAASPSKAATFSPRVLAGGRAATAAELSQIPGVPSSATVKDLTDELGPGWMVAIVSRKPGGSKQFDYHYFSPTGERFRSMKDAANAALEARGNNIRGVAQGDEKVPRSSFSLIAASASATDEGASNGDIGNVNIGAVGYKFQKNFNGRWYEGVVVKVLSGVGNGNDRRCHYPEDNDYEDLSLGDLLKLADLEKNRDGDSGEQRDMQHNDLCETCGEGGELLCCSTCNLVFHLGCTRPKLAAIPDDDWCCCYCIASGVGVVQPQTKASKEQQQKAKLAVREIEAIKEDVQSRRKSPRARKIASGIEGFEYF